MKIGLIAGSGDLPGAVINAAQSQGYGVYVAQLGDARDIQYPGAELQYFKMAEIGKVTKAFHKAACTHVCFAGHVDRPDFRSLRPDWKGLWHLPGALKAARQGDDALLTYMVGIFEKQGFKVIAPQSLCQSLLLPVGALGQYDLLDKHHDDVQKAARIAQEIGRMDIGQGAIVCHGLVLAVEAQEGTDAMLKRVAGLPEAIRGTVDNRRGVLAKMIKPGQERRIDLPTIGPATVRYASAAGLSGIVAEADGAFVLNREEVVRLADEAGIFIVGLPAASS